MLIRIGNNNSVKSINQIETDREMINKKKTKDGNLKDENFQFQSNKNREKIKFNLDWLPANY